MEWLIPISVSWIVAAIYLGAWPLDVKGGKPPLQVLGVLISVALFVGAWAVLHTFLGSLGAVGRLVIPTALSVLLYPALAWVSFRICGARIRWGAWPPPPGPRGAVPGGRRVAGAAAKGRAASG
jgi:hypothetical protein